MSFPFPYMQPNYSGRGANTASSSSSRPTKLRCVALSHLTHPTNATPASQQHQNQLSTSVTTASCAGSSQQPPSERTTAGQGCRNGSVPHDPFLLPSHNLPHHSGGTGDCTSNIAKWSAFGLNTARYVPQTGSRPPHEATPHLSQQPSSSPSQGRALPPAGVSDAHNLDGNDDDDSGDDGGEVLFCGFSSASSSQVVLSNVSVKAVTGGAVGSKLSGGCVHDDAQGEGIHLRPLVPGQGIHAEGGGAAREQARPPPSDSMRLLRKQLSELSARVNEAAERERCGPPKPNGKKGGGGAPAWQRHKKESARRKKKGTEEDSNGCGDQGEEGEGTGGHREDSGTATNTKRERPTDDGPAASSSSSSSSSSSPTRARRTAKQKGEEEGRGRGVTKRPPAKGTGNRKAPGGKRGGRKVKEHEASKQGQGKGQWRSLFPFRDAEGEADPGNALTTRSRHPQVGGGQGSPGGGSSIPCVQIDSDDAVNALFAELENALNDPDRIQAPPLFLGILYTSGDTNFSLSGLSRGKALLPAACPIAQSGDPSDKGSKGESARATNPKMAHRYVSQVVLRWRDRMFSMAAHRFGFPFLLRVLRDLVGVEVITFDAPVALLVLLCAANGDLGTHCVSDVRVMAWMAALTSPSMDNESSGGGRKGSEDVASPAPMHGSASVSVSNALVYDYRALLEQYGGGGVGGYTSTLLCPTGAYQQRNVARTGNTSASPSREAWQRMSLQHLVNDTYHLAPLYRALYGVLGAKGLLQAFLRQEKRIPLMIASMKREGLRVNMREVRRFKDHCVAQMHQLRDRASAYVPQLVDFNIQSPDQVRVALYEVLQLGKFLVPAHQRKQDLDTRHGQPTDEGDEEGEGGGGGEVRTAANVAPPLTTNSVVITRGGKLSTAEDTLRLLAQHHEFPRIIMQYRKFAKVLQTYVDGMMSFAIPCEAATRAGGTGAGAGAGGLHTRGMEVEEEEEEEKERNGSSEPSVFRDNALGTVAVEPPVRRAAGSDRDEGEEEGDVSRGSHRRSESPPSLAPVMEVDFALLHPNFLQEGTDTGRLSCVEPNLQNLPRTAMDDGTGHERSGEAAGHAAAVGSLAPHLSPSAAGVVPVREEDAREPPRSEELLFRRCFVAPSGEHTLLSVDFQQIELRVLAHLCADAALVEALSSGHADIHRNMAEILLKKRPVSVEERNMSKKVVFGVLYGAGPRTLAAQLGVTVERAIFVSSLLKNAFPQIHTYHQKIIQQGRADGFVRTISGRIRHLRDINCAVMGKRAHAERQAFNTVIQGSAADVMKMAMLAVERDVLRPLRDDVQLLMQIHDEMIFAVRKEKLALVVPLVTRAMSRAMSLLVPLNVTAKFGPSLGELQEWSVDHDLGLV